MENWEIEAENFLRNDTEFRLGFLPSEARNPLTMHLDDDFRESTVKGVRTLLSCDRALMPFIRQTLVRKEYAFMADAMRRARRIIFSGCGATGRLAILLESAWNEAHPDEPRVLSLMTGGDFALVKSVENFEDYPAAGKKQVDEFGVTREDILVGITATGETASILGSAKEAAQRGADVFMLICVPVETAASGLERCRELYSFPNVTVIDMPIGGMALTGSTRMQSSTIELLMAASALETASGTTGIDYAAAFESLQDSLETPESVESLAACIDSEWEICRTRGLIDYVADDLLIDLLSDTTERSPTFMIPPYKFRDDDISPEPWAMVRDLSAPTPDIWLKCLRRPPRCIEWSEAEYRAAGLEILLKNGLPRISERELRRVPIGNEFLPSRANACRVEIRNEKHGPLFIGEHRIGGPLTPTPLRLFEHLRMKLAMNIISTGTMVRFGRVKSNYMIHLAISNKKLVDRACRIISELCGIDYETACHELFRTCASLKSSTLSPVAETLRRLTPIRSGSGKP